MHHDTEAMISHMSSYRGCDMVLITIYRYNIAIQRPRYATSQYSGHHMIYIAIQQSHYDMYHNIDATMQFISKHRQPDMLHIRIESTVRYVPKIYFEQVNPKSRRCKFYAVILNLYYYILNLCFCFDFPLNFNAF